MTRLDIRKNTYIWHFRFRKISMIQESRVSYRFKNWQHCCGVACQISKKKIRYIQCYGSSWAEKSCEVTKVFENDFGNEVVKFHIAGSDLLNGYGTKNRACLPNFKDDENINVVPKASYICSELLKASSKWNYPKSAIDIRLATAQSVIKNFIKHGAASHIVGWHVTSRRGFGVDLPKWSHNAV